MIKCVYTPIYREIDIFIMIYIYINIYIYISKNYGRSSVKVRYTFGTRLVTVRYSRNTILYLIYIKICGRMWYI